MTAEQWQPGQARNVEELADENDYWLVSKDAARVTRQPHETILQWIQTGRLPVRPAYLTPMKQMQVRASDLAQLAPIVAQERYVEELAGPDDCWLSMTDAARVAGIHDKTIQNWIKNGVLAVRPGGAGMNKRTRQVRRSDLAELTPIINPDAGIATRDGSVYLASVPAELAGIKADYQRLLALVTAFPQQVQMQTAEMMGGLSALSGTLEERDQRHLHRMETVESTLSEQIARMQEVILSEVRQVEEQLGQRLRDQMTQTQDSLSALLTSHGERMLHQLEAIATTLSRQEQERKQQDRQIAEQAERRHQEFISLIEQQDQQDSERLATYGSEVERILREVREEIGKHIGTTGGDLGAHLERLEATILKEMRLAERRIDALAAVQEPLLTFLADLRAGSGLPQSPSAGKPEDARTSQ